MFKQIVSDCHNHRGVLFGGVVRDFYLHEYNERLYRQKNGYGQAYEFKDRFLMPKDIDCLILEVDHEKLISMLQKKYFIQYQFDSDADYLVDVPNGLYRFHRYTLLELHERPILIQLELMVQLNGVKVVPFVHFDLDVNTLLWSKHSIRVNPIALPILAALYGIDNNTAMRELMTHSILFDHIISKNATICTPTCSEKRIRKMKRRGWKIHHQYETIHLHDDPYEGVCVLCQDTISGFHSTFHCKCAHICMPCLGSHYELLTKCTICKKSIDPIQLKNDVRMYSAIHLDPVPVCQDLIFTFIQPESVD